MEKLARQEEIQKLKTQHEAVLEAEDKKYHRRLASFQDRLTAKDKEYNEFMSKQTTTSPNDNDDREALIESLKVELAQEKAKQPTVTSDVESTENKVCLKKKGGICFLITSLRNLRKN
jgi:hypothetical protein